MPFRESSALEERIALLRAYDAGGMSVTELCQQYGISRETFYQWKGRREAGDERWFEERSRAPLSVPHATPSALRERVVAMRLRFPRFGPKKIKACLEADDGQTSWPSASTIGEILKAEGLSVPKRRRRRARRGETVTDAAAPNDEWAIDFKGWFRTKDGARCDPLTVSDTASRYLLEARITPPTHDGVKGVLQRLFSETGMPKAIRSDNGTPFGSTGAGGLSRLSVWFLKLGIEPLHIPPASPQDNGRHERMHRTLKEETALTPAASHAQQQARFDAFRCHYNEERPHEALGQKMPASQWHAPLRLLPAVIEDPWYDANHQVRRTRPDGSICWRGSYVFIGEAFAREPVGLAEIDLGLHVLRFCHRDFGLLDRTGRFHRFAPPRARLRSAPKPAMS